MKRSLRIITPVGRATHMPASRAAGVREERRRKILLDARVCGIFGGRPGPVACRRVRVAGRRFWQRARGRAAAWQNANPRRDGRGCSQRSHAPARSVRCCCGARSKHGAAGLKSFGQHEGFAAHHLSSSHGTFLQNLAQAWPFRPDLSKFYGGGLTTSGRQSFQALRRRLWPLICFLVPREPGGQALIEQNGTFDPARSS